MSDQKNEQPQSPLAASSATTTAASPAGQRSELGAGALTLVLWLLLIDAAVETFLSGAPVRWWVAGVVAAYLGLTAVVWRASGDRFGWSRRATASFFVLLGLLAATVWLPDGLTNGVAMLRQPTSIVLSAVSALAVAAAGLLLVRVRFLPLWARAALSLLTLYAIAAFVLGITNSTPYPDLFQGESAWRRLPLWLQGATLGAVVILPLGIIVGLLGSGIQPRRLYGGPRAVRQAIALVLSFTIATSGLVRVAGPVRNVADRQGHSQTPIEELPRQVQASYDELGAALHSGQRSGSHSVEATAQELDRLFEVLAAEGRRLPRESFDPQRLVEMNQRDPLRLFHWVKNNTQLVPYRGLLRGSTGVLLDRVGNSLDRASLLYFLLKAAGQQVRLVRGTLTAPQVQQVIQTIQAAPIRQASRPAADGQTDEEARILTHFPMTDPTIVVRHREKLRHDQQTLKDSIQREANIHSAFLATAFDRTPDAERSLMEGTLRDHWWVQWHNESTWVDLDTTFPNAAVGDHLAMPHEVFQPGSPADLPSELQHSLNIRIVIEQSKDGVLKQHEVLDHTLRPTELYGVPITFMNYPLQWPEDLKMLGAGDIARRLKEAIPAQKEWLPILRIGSDVVSQSSFTVLGEVNTKPLAPLLGSSAQNLGRRLGGSLSSGQIGGIEGRKLLDEGHLTAEWIEYSISAPGRPTRKITREILDLIGPAGRSAATQRRDPSEAESAEARLSLAGQIDILPVAAQPSTSFVEHLLAASLVANRDIVIGLVRGSQAGDAKSLSESAGKFVTQPFNLYGLALLRNNWSSLQGDVYLDRINVLTYRKHFVADAAGNLRLLTGFDIVANEVAVRPGARAHPFSIRLQQGVLDTHFEAVLAASSCGDGAGQACGSIRNAAQTLSHYGRSGVTWVTVRKVSDDVWRRIQLPNNVRARIEQDLERGYAVVVPNQIPKEGSVSWWRVDPRTGDALGIGELGWGQTAAEWVGIYTVMLGMVWFWYCTIRTIQKAGSDPGKDGMDFVKCNFDFICILVALVVAIPAASPFLAVTITAMCRVIKYELPASF